MKIQFKYDFELEFGTLSYLYFWKKFSAFSCLRYDFQLIRSFTNLTQNLKWCATVASFGRGWSHICPFSKTVKKMRWNWENEKKNENFLILKWRNQAIKLVMREVQKCLPPQGLAEMMQMTCLLCSGTMEWFLRNCLGEWRNFNFFIR